MNIAFNLPINRVSFGQVSTLILRTLFDRERLSGEQHNIFLFPIANQIDLGSQKQDQSFNNWIMAKVANAMENYDRDIPVFKLWHLNGSLESVSRKQNLLTFYELDEPTKLELCIGKNNNLYFSSKYSCEVFANSGVKANYIPLGFDSYNFTEIKRKFNSDRIVFNLCGKFENRKHHAKIIQAWIKKYGNNPKYALQCAIFNPFLNEEQNKNAIANIVKGNKPFNVNFYPLMAENSIYNEFLNSADIIIGMSGAEGFGLPEFQSVALGKHAVLLKAHAYKDWAQDNMVTWVNPNGKTPAYDGMFFQKGQPFNQGNIFTFDDEEFLAACDVAISKAQSSKVNTAGYQLQMTHSKEMFVDAVLNTFKQ